MTLPSGETRSFEDGDSVDTERTWRCAGPRSNRLLEPVRETVRRRGLTHAHPPQRQYLQSFQERAASTVRRASTREDIMAQQRNARVLAALTSDGRADHHRLAQAQEVTLKVAHFWPPGAMAPTRAGFNRGATRSTRTRRQACARFTWRCNSAARQRNCSIGTRRRRRCRL